MNNADTNHPSVVGTHFVHSLGALRAIAEVQESMNSIVVGVLSLRALMSLSFQVPAFDNSLLADRTGDVS